jgi:anti-sigma regulatory factor (Ser/Thr protein kinase)
MRLRADTRAPGLARAHVRGIANRAAVSDATCDDLVLIASELVTNAVQSGADDISISVVVSAEGFLLTVNDDGPGWPVMSGAPAAAEHGRGLAIVDHLADSWEVVPQARGKRVRATRGLPGPTGAILG